MVRGVEEREVCVDGQKSTSICLIACSIKINLICSLPHKNFRRHAHSVANESACIRTAHWIGGATVWWMSIRRGERKKKKGGGGK